ncbi:hypothetical protein LXA43DRAFT_983264 [Ganoderma leucocontextum]|nr:hypothetical protein LXA43DRAFT_983264 [Ganoderma leucocontextum]
MPDPDHRQNPAHRQDIPPLQPAPWRFGQYQVRPEVAQLSQHKRLVLRQCSYCGKTGFRNLPQCSLCKSARYCNTKCQRADYLKDHRLDCIGFGDPPFTPAFLTNPIGDARYAVDPLFGRGERDGIGTWISVSSSIDCTLSALVYPLRPQNDEAEIRRRLRRAETDRGTALKYKAHTSNLLTLQLLVQNRRKDGLPAIIFGALSQVITLAKPMEAVYRGSPGDDVERIAKFKVSLTLTSPKMEVAAIGVARDPWDETPRLYIKNFNGTELHPDSTLPPAIHSASRGIVELYPGDFVLLHLQFRVGDGRTAGIDKDVLALANLFGFALPLRSPCTCGDDPTVLDAALDASFGPGNIAEGLTSMFNDGAIKAYYNDLIQRGERAHIESHHGRAHVEQWEQRRRQAGRKRPEEYSRMASAHVR